MAAVEYGFRLTKEAAKALANGTAELTPGGVRDVATKKIIGLARPYTYIQNKLTNKQMLQNLTNSMQTVQALSFLNAAISLVNVGVSVAGFYMVLKKMEAMNGELHTFFETYKNDREADQLEAYRKYLENSTSHIHFLQNRYTNEEYNKTIFMIRETDIEKECNEADSFLVKILSQYQKGEISAALATQILFTLSAVYGQLVKEYCYQYYCVHGRQHEQFEGWKSVLDQINSDSFRTYIKREMTFGIQYVQLPPERRKDAMDVAFDCIQEVQDQLLLSQDALPLVPADRFVPVEEVISQKAWNDLWKQLNEASNGQPEEYFRQQYQQMAIDEDDDSVYIPRMAAYGMN